MSASRRACVVLATSSTSSARSVYRWEGAIERADEVLLVAKTTHARLDALIERIRALHPNELPEVIAFEVAGGLAAYLDWVAEQTRTDA